MIHRDPSPSLPLFDAPPQRDQDAMFDAANVGIYDLFRTLARKVKANGWDRFSADELLHQIRWFHRIERGDRAFKCNDHWTSYLARRLAREHPNEFAEFFEFRKSRHDAQSA